MAVPIVIPFDVLELSIFKVEVLSNEMLEPSTTSVPSISVLSKFVVPSMSASPDMSNVAASSSPVSVTFLNPDISLLESTITANEADTVPAVMPSTKFNSAAVDVTAVPFIDRASVSKVPSMSASPDISSVAASNSPVSVTFLNDPISLFESTTTALLAATVPAVTPSIVSNSASLMFADPIIKPVAVNVPLTVSPVSAA